MLSLLRCAVLCSGRGARSAFAAASANTAPHAAALLGLRADCSHGEACQSASSVYTWDQSFRSFARSARKLDPKPPPNPDASQPRRQQAWGATDGTTTQPPNAKHKHPHHPAHHAHLAHDDSSVPAIITARIAGAKTLADLQDVLHANRQLLNCIHLSAGFTRLAKLRPAGTADSALARQVLESLCRGFAAADTDVGSREIANVVWACGKLASLGIPAQFVARLVSLALSDDGHLGRATPQHLASLAYGFARLGCVQLELWARLAAAVDARLPEFTPRQMATVLSALARAGLRDPLEGRLMDALVACFRQVDHKTYVHLAWALAELAPGAHPLPAMLAEACARKVRLLDHQALSQAVRMAAKVRLRDADVVHRLMTAVLRMPELFAPPELASVVWAAAALQYADELTFTKLIDCAVEVAPRLDARDLTLLVASLAKAAHLPPRVPATALEPVLAALRPQVARLSAMDVASLLTALGKLQYRNAEELLEAVGQRAAALAPQMGDQALANTLWACAVLDFKPPELVQALEAALQREGLQLGGQSLAMAVWAAAGLFPSGSKAIDRLLAMVVQNGQSLQVMDLVQVAYALAKLQVADTEVFSVLEQHSSRQLHEFDGHMLVSLATSFMRVELLTSGLVEQLLEHKNVHPERWGHEDLERLSSLLVKMA